MLIQRIEYKADGDRVPLDPGRFRRAARGYGNYQMSTDVGAYHYVRIVERNEAQARAAFAEFQRLVMSLPGYVGLEASDIDTRSDPDPLHRHVGVAVLYAIDLPAAQRRPGMDSRS